MHTYENDGINRVVRCRLGDGSRIARKARVPGSGALVRGQSSYARSFGSGQRQASQH